MKKKKTNSFLTRAEEEVMQILWEMKKGFVKNIIKKFPDPKPAYNTVSTIIRILEKKGFVAHKAFGNTFEYYPLVLKDEYRKHYVNAMMNNYFGGSFKQLASFLIDHDKLDVRELEEILNLIKKDPDQKQQPDKNAS
ncbi:MAG: BlaI/MecI/CopY family transcriptional regulator [Bacteroidales bacterium]|nr:BlaI/MecI/CopY family transcriptional regulator [Bacteroidales bacterium]